MNNHIDRTGAWGFAALLLIAATGCEFNAAGVNRPDALFRHDLPVAVDGEPPPDLGPDVTIAPLPDVSISDSGDCLSRNCKDGTLYCGDALERVCPLGCNKALTDCARFVPSNIDIAAFSLGVAELVISTDTVFDTTELVLKVDGKEIDRPEGVQVHGPQEYALIACTKLTVESGVTFKVRGQRPLVIAAGSEIVVKGSIDCAAEGNRPGPGGYRGGNHSEGEGCGGGYSGEAQPLLLKATGGPGGSNGGRGGRGGANGAIARAPCNSDDLIPLKGGSGGGGGVDMSSGVMTTGNHGGAGGGAVQLSALDYVQVASTGKINCSGGGGGMLVFNSGAGGGSGGSILLEAAEVDIDGVVSANGGGGGAGATDVPGDPGDDGRADDKAAAGGAASPGVFVLSTTGDGGAGSAGDKSSGEAGGAESAGGGGGGGAGRIVIRTKDARYGGGNKQILSPRKTGLKTYRLLEVL